MTRSSHSKRNYEIVQTENVKLQVTFGDTEALFHLEFILMKMKLEINSRG